MEVRNRRAVIGGAVAALLLFACLARTGADESGPSTQREAERLFALKVLPLLRTKCFGCHGDDADNIKGEFDMRTRVGLLKGGESEEPSIVAGKPQESPLYQAVLWDGLEMPPKENDRLTEKEIELVRRWIADGAPWPNEERQQSIRKREWSVQENEDGMLVSTSGGLADSWTYRRYQREDIWAFQPLEKPDVPAGFDNPVDAFVHARLEAKELTAADVADARTLIRRATFDLTGLPPTPKEIDAFEAAWSDNSKKAWADLIDRLLASPQYGERWARHWLDVTRYADTGGMANDFERSNMWRYRDYVIRAFNNDKPYNEFIVEQLAGDELADQSVRARKGEAAVHKTQLSGDYTPQEAEWIVATGFLRLGPWDNAMVMEDEARQMYLDDLVNITGQTFLAQTLRCCKCHDHKFDPLPTRDYYRIYAAFSATHMAERPVPFLDQENREGFREGKAHVQRMLDFAVAEKQKLIDKREAAARAWFEEHDLPYKNDQQRNGLPDDKKPPRHVGLDHVEQGQLKVREQDEWIWKRRLERYQPMAQSVFNSGGARLAWNAARKLRIHRKPGKAPESYILTGGALTARGAPVRPGVLSGIGLPVDPQAEDPYLVTSAIDGRRLGLANWIAHPENGLTSRAIVNRIWQSHFGTGLAKNSNNFGAKGDKPSHPKLLDYLAADFVEHGWKIKRLHRLIMLSESYQRASLAPDAEKVAQVDPSNRLLSFFPRRRLGAEEIRDGILQITGELVHRNGGLPVMPEINMEVALQPRMIQFSLAPAYQPSRTPEQRNSRTIYAYHVRGQADPFTELFNQPQPNESCERREAAAVTPQVFTLLNSDLMTDRSVAFALRLQREVQGEVGASHVRRAIDLAFGRDATDDEVERLGRYLQDMVVHHNKTPAKPTTYPTTITRSLVEEFSGKVFEYQEILPVFADYVADKKSADVPAETRALADLCLLLFNANEFIYVN